MKITDIGNNNYRYTIYHSKCKYSKKSEIVPNLCR